MEFSRSVVFNFLTRSLSDKSYHQLRSFLLLGKLPDLNEPVLFDEKILWRMLYDRKPIYTRITDKVALHDYVRDEGLSKFLPRRYFEGANPKDIPFADLPTKFVVKPNHASGYIQFVNNKEELDRERLIRICQDWLRINYYQRSREWIYQDILPKIIVEEHLGDGVAGTMYTFHCFHGEPHHIFVHVDKLRLNGIHQNGRFDLDWTPMATDPNPELNRNIPRPERLHDMIEAAKIFSRDFDYIRVDLYQHPGRLILGELTLTPGAGTSSIPLVLQKEMGALWSLDTGK